MILKVYLVNVILLSFFDVELCFASIWNILIYISWCSLLVLAISTFFWKVSIFYIVLDVPYLPNCDFPLGFSSWFSCYLVYRFFLLYIPLYFFFQVKPFSCLNNFFLFCCVSLDLLLLLLFFFWLLWFSLLFSVAIICSLKVEYLCCLL